MRTIDRALLELILTRAQSSSWPARLQFAINTRPRSAFESRGPTSAMATISTHIYATCIA